MCPGLAFESHYLANPVGYLSKAFPKQYMVMHTCNFNTQGAEAGGSLNSRPA